MDRLFVYGTLKKGLACENDNHYMRGMVFDTIAVLRGHTLVDLGPFPMAVQSSHPDAFIEGEIYHYPKEGARAIQASLDRYEGSMYERVLLQTHQGPVDFYRAKGQRTKECYDSVWPSTS